MANRHLGIGKARDLRLLGVVALVAVVAAALVVAAWSRHHSPPVRSAHPARPAPPTRPTGSGAGSSAHSGGPCWRPLTRPAKLSPRSSRPSPAEARPVACYPNLAQATAAGYPPAPLPTRVVELGEVYLTPTGRAFRTRCQRAADQLGFVVPCPALLPTAAPGTAPPELCQGRMACSGEQVFIVNDAGFLVPPGYLGVEQQPQGHLVIMAAPRRPSDPRPPNDVLGCYADQPVATATIHGTRPSCWAVPAAQRSTAATPWFAGPSEGSTWASACTAGAS